MNAQIDVTGIQIETERLILRPWRETDLRDLYEYAQVDGVGQMAGWLPHKDMAESRMILNMFIQEKKVLALELKESGKVIGSLGLEANDNDHVGSDYLGREVGYVLSRDYWGRGLMPEAVKAVCRYCFEILGYDYLLCGHFIRNAQSRRVIEKCGFTYLKNILHDTRYHTVEETMLYILRNPNK